MSDIIIAGNMNFESISEFKQSLSWGAEIEFRWKGKTYDVIRYGTDNKIEIWGLSTMSPAIVPANTPEQNRFKTISDFKDCIRWGGEVEFSWNGIIYDVTHRSSGEISIAVAYQQDTEKLCATPDEALDYMVGPDRLRDVITKVTVLDRTI